jgi:4-aminobutyrate aminotransferase-like enzyme
LDSRHVAVEIVKAAYLGEPEEDGIHLLGPLAGNVIRISPPNVITFEQARESLDLLYRVVSRLAAKGTSLGPVTRAALVAAR